MKAIPNQLDEDTANAIEAAGETVGAALNAQFSFNIVLNMLISSSLSTLITSIKSI